MCKIKSNSEMWHSLFQTPVYIIDQTFQKSASTHGTMQSSRSHPLNLEGAEHNDASFFLYSDTLYRRIEVWVMTLFPMMPEWCPITSTHIEFWKLDSTIPLHWRFQIHSCTFIGYICLKYYLSALARIRKMVKMMVIPSLTQGAKTHDMCMKSTSMKYEESRVTRS